MSEFNRYPSTDDSAESLKHRPKSPLNRNWTWSPKAPGSHHIIENINYKGDDHPIGNIPYEVVEASDNILSNNNNIEESDPYQERKDFNEDEIKKKRRNIDEDTDESENIIEYDLGSYNELNEEECEEVSDEEEHATAVFLGTQIVLAALEKVRFDKLFGRN